MQEPITVGIGLFISYIGLTNAGIIQFGASSVTNGIAMDVVPQISLFQEKSVILAQAMNETESKAHTFFNCYQNVFTEINKHNFQNQLKATKELATGEWKKEV